MKKKDVGRTATKADVEIHKPEDGEDEVMIVVRSADGSDLTANQILEAVAEALILYWDNAPIEPRDDAEFDA